MPHPHFPSETRDRQEMSLEFHPPTHPAAAPCPGLLAGLLFALRQRLVLLQHARWWRAMQLVGVERLMKWLAAMIARHLSRVMMVRGVESVGCGARSGVGVEMQLVGVEGD
eukprot:353928-Chlamydomonas_euryale.AAC.4